MNKLLLAAVAVIVPSVAMAQASGSPPTDAGTPAASAPATAPDASAPPPADSSSPATSAPAPAATPDAASPTAATAATPPADTSAAVAPAANPAPAASSGPPAKDARGISVVSAPATAPAGANQSVTVPAGGTVTVNPNQSAVFAPTAASGDVPACSKTVTDNCKQTYEGKGDGKASRHHHKK